MRINKCDFCDATAEWACDQELPNPVGGIRPYHCEARLCANHRRPVGRKDYCPEHAAERGVRETDRAGG